MQLPSIAARQTPSLPISSIIAETKQTPNEKSARRRCKHCALAVVSAEPKIFAPPQRRRPTSRGRGTAKILITWKCITTFTYRPSLVRIYASNFELSLVPTNTHTNPQTDRTDYNTLRRS